MSVLRPAGGRLHPLRIFLAVLTMIVTVSGICTPVAAGDAGPFTIVAEFDSASPLVVGNEVKIFGVPVGRVERMEVHDGKAAVTLSVDPSALPLHNDAHATVRPVSLLGERYVDLDRGSPAAAVLRPGGSLPTSQTGQATDLDQILNTVNEPTGKSLSALVSVLGEGVQGNGPNADATMKALAPAMTDTNKLVGVLNDQNTVLNQLVDSASPVASALASDQGKSLDGLVKSTNNLLGTTAAKQQGLQDSLTELPGTLAQARKSLGDLTGTAQATAPTLQAMRPTTDNLSAISGELNRFSDSANPALANADPVLHRADQLLTQARPVVADLKKAGPDLRGTAAGAKPIVNNFTDHLPGFWNFIQGWALTTNGKDGLSHYFRALITVNTDEVTHLLPPPGVAAPPGPGSAPDPSLPQLPGLPSLPGNTPPFPGLPNLVPPADGGAPGGLLQPGPGDSHGGATGLDQQQEGNALEFLLGGR